MSNIGMNHCFVKRSKITLPSLNKAFRPSKVHDCAIFSQGGRFNCRPDLHILGLTKRPAPSSATFLFFCARKHLL
jgi:hypothetical protein